MKKIRNILAAVLVLATILSLVACGGKNSGSIERNEMFTKAFYEPVTLIEIRNDYGMFPSYLTDKGKISEFSEFMDTLELTSHKESTDTDEENPMMGGFSDVYFYANEDKVGIISVENQTVYIHGVPFDANEVITNKLDDLIGAGKVNFGDTSADLFNADFYDSVTKIECFTDERPYTLTDGEKIKSFGEFLGSLTLTEPEVSDEQKYQFFTNGDMVRFLITNSDGVWQIFASETAVFANNTTYETDQNIFDKFLELCE